jgi:hypothetical protein
MYEITKTDSKNYWGNQVKLVKHGNPYYDTCETGSSAVIFESCNITMNNVAVDSSPYVSGIGTYSLTINIPNITKFKHIKFRYLCNTCNVNW